MCTVLEFPEKKMLMSIRQHWFHVNVFIASKLHRYTFIEQCTSDICTYPFRCNPVTMPSIHVVLKKNIEFRHQSAFQHLINKFTCVSRTWNIIHQMEKFKSLLLKSTRQSYSVIYMTLKHRSHNKKKQTWTDECRFHKLWNLDAGFHPYKYCQRWLNCWFRKFRH